MATPAIFPSVSRNFSLDTSQTTEDDTIRDSMEMGYVATRPRFSRARRTWKGNYRNITAEDVRALQLFRDVTVKRGALPFYLPNLVPNGSFEVPAFASSGQVADQWYQDPAETVGSLAIASGAYDGATCVKYASTAAQSLAGVNSVIARLMCGKQIPVNVGDVLLCAFRLSIVANTSAIPLYMEILLTVTYSDGTVQNSAQASLLGSAAGAGWVPVSHAITIPAAPSGSPALYATLALGLVVQGSTPVATVGAGAIAALLDSVGLALTSTITPAPAMLGGGVVTRPVRFSKLPEFADVGWVGGGKGFGCTFEVTEL